MDSPHRGLTARRRFWVVVFALISLGIMAGGLEYYRYEQEYIRREKYQDLAAIADLKVRQILEWRRERLDNARSMARDPFLGKAIAEWLRDPGNPGLRAALLERLKVEKEGGAYGNVLLADPDGRILLSVRPDPAPLSPAGKQALDATVAGRQAVLGDLFRCPKDHRVHLDLAAPVMDPRGQPLAVVVLRTNVDEVLYPLIQSWPTPSLTAETLLVEVEGKDILYLNELRHREKTALSLREPLTQTELPAVQAGLGKQGVFEGRDYRGKKVLADLRPVPQSPWFMVAKVDADEILAEARYRAGITALFVFIFILLTAAVTAYIYRHRQANLYQDLYQTEREQRQAQEEFRTTLYSIGDAVITTDTEGLVKHINPVAERLTGWLEAEARGKPLEEVFRIINEETRAAVESPAQRVLREGVVVGLANHTLLVARDGTESPIADSGAPIRDENGAVIGVVLVFRDQTEERAAQNALRESEEKYRLLINQIPSVVFNGFEDWSVDFFDNKIEALTGFAKEEFDSRKIKWSDLILPEDLDKARRNFIDALKNNKSYLREYRIRRKDGAIRWIQARGKIFCDDRGKLNHVSGVFFDITDHKQAEGALKDHLYFLQTLLDTIPTPIFYKNVGGVYLGCNKGLSDFLGLPKEEIIGKSVYDVFPKDLADKYFETDAALFRNPGVQIYDFSMRHADGTIHDVNFNKATYSTADGTLAGLVGVMIDITDRKRAEVERLRFSKLESLATLAGGIAHDFNNILTVILGNISLARLDFKNEEYTRKRLNETEGACLKAQMLAQQLLTFAKGGAPMKELVSLENLVTETGSFACSGSKAKCTFSFPDDFWAIEADPGQLIQVIQNLVINALQAMPTGGTIKVKGENLVVKAQSDLPLGAGKYVKISIQDQGVGIPADHLARIFDPYFTTKQTGSGLGLATAYSVVNSHHGYISVESTLGVGTTFHVSLPAVDQKITSPRGEEIEVLVGQGKILVMDDEEMVRNILGTMVSRLGYKVELATDGTEAIELFTLAQESGKAFDAVILDLTVPGGIGGKETLEKLLRIDPRVKAIVSSGYSDDPIMAEFTKFGFSGVIAKPYRISELSKLLNKVLSKGK